MIYNQQTILGLQLNTMMSLQKLTRAEFFTRLQLIRIVEPVTMQAYKEVEEKHWREQLNDDPHGDKWHVSFHGSQFPGNDQMACPRQALYRMMDFPAASPFNRRSRVIMAAGKAIETELVRTWHEAGILLSASPFDKHQTGFELPDAWLTSSVDAIILPQKTRMPLPVEIKTKFQKDIDEMKLGRGPDPSHISQIKVQIAFVRAYQLANMWLSLDQYELVTHGVIYYLSRDNPANTAEFRVDYDEDFFVAGIEQLKRWRAFFEEDYLPELNPTRRGSKFGHPNGWRWSKSPCQLCSYKKTCQLDFQEKTTQLSNSIGCERAKLVRPDYDAESARLRVRARWSKKKYETKEQDQQTTAKTD